jgi:AcrR family transcriptional regulator
VIDDTGRPGDAEPQGRRKLLNRGARRAQLVRAATTAFARAGFSATSLAEIAEQAVVTKVLIYRHFASKSELYLAALTDARDRLRARVGTPDAYDADTVRAFVGAAHDDPDGFRLLFRHAAREPEFADYAAGLNDDAARIAEESLRVRVPHTAHRQWLAGLLPLITIEATLSWLDAGRPVGPDQLAAVVRAALAALTAPAGAPGAQAPRAMK